MSCPDELTLELWSAQALPAEELSAVSAHVAACAECRVRQERLQAIGDDLRVALELNPQEHAYLASLDLPAAWRTSPASAFEASWGWLALFGVLAAFAAWSLAAQPAGDLLDLANLVGLGTLLLTTSVGAVLSLGQWLIDVSTNPALGFSQPLLAVLALTLLFWPRIVSAPHFLQGVRS
jgi:hypothetical protein